MLYTQNKRTSPLRDMFCYMIVMVILVAAFYYTGTDAHAASRTVSSASELQSALNGAGSGDVITLTNGVYNGSFSVKAGVTIKAQNKHKAILRGNGSRSASNSFHVSGSNAVVEGLRIEDYYIGVNAGNVNNVTIRDNLIIGFNRSGINFGGSNWKVYNNVIGLSQQWDTGGRGVRVNSGDDNKIYNNILYAISGDGLQAYGPEGGGCYSIHPPATRNLFQGNVCLLSGDKSNGRIWTKPGDGDINSNHVFRDNILAHGEAGGWAPGDTKSIDNIMANNLCYSAHTCASGKGNIPGRNQVLHNTAIVTPHSGPTQYEAGRQSGQTESNRVFKSNLAYSALSQPSEHRVFLHSAINPRHTYGDRHTHNLYWAPWDQSKWAWGRESDFQFSSTDIHSPAQRPRFKDEAKGDFTLAPGSPGYNAGHDGKSMGIEWNQYLTLAKFQHVFFLPQYQKETNGATNISFNVKPGHEYLVEIFVPHSGFFTGNEPFTVESNRMTRDMNELFVNNSRWYTGKHFSGNNRYMPLGNFAVSNDGVLNISWNHGNAVEKVWILELPTAEQAYGWLTGVPPPAGPTGDVITDPGGPVTPGPNPTPNPTPVPMNPTPCARYQSGDPAPSPYALAWNWLSSGKELLMDALCESTRTTVTIGKAGGGTGGGSTVYTWGKAYNYTGSYWDQSHPIQLTCNGTKYPTTDVTPGDKTPDFWCHGTATGVIPAATSFFVGYTCIRNGSSWQCGCTTQACTQTFWQLQGVKH